MEFSMQICQRTNGPKASNWRTCAGEPTDLRCFHTHYSEEVILSMTHYTRNKAVVRDVSEKRGQRSPGDDVYHSSQVIDWITLSEIIFCRQVVGGGRLLPDLPVGIRWQEGCDDNNQLGGYRLLNQRHTLEYENKNLKWCFVVFTYRHPRRCRPPPSLWVSTYLNTACLRQCCMCTMLHVRTNV